MYVCKTLIQNTCIEWVSHDNQGFMSFFSQLTFAEANQLLSLTALLFLNAWSWRFLSKQAER
ncbi:Uncharacterised protein [Moraxella equi]|uniref:Uncharacterized protein n=1 Tax=Moraxella equi TaxID=60442 RepID=A0A378QRC8_9GAMM|nr:Uncharacterised protein [Moraxella equi]STZ03012.1 Uncharacterised protein [Moraxella equi]